MEVLPMVSMALSPDEKSKYDCVPMACDQPNYPYGLSISLGDKELEKLGISFDDIETDNVVHLHALGVITSKSSNVVQGTQPTCRVEIQLTHLAADNEDEENEEEEQVMTMSKKINTLYTK